MHDIIYFLDIFVFLPLFIAFLYLISLYYINRIRKFIELFRPQNKA